MVSNSMMVLFHLVLDLAHDNIPQDHHLHPQQPRLILPQSHHLLLKVNLALLFKTYQRLFHPDFSLHLFLLELKPSHHRSHYHLRYLFPLQLRDLHLHQLFQLLIDP